MAKPLVNHKSFIAQRYDILIRFYFLELVGYDVEKARQLYESKEYGFLKPVLERTELFVSKEKKTWEYIDDKLRSERGWMRHFPYLITKGGHGLSVKRFLLTVKYEGFRLYWMEVDHHADMGKVGFYKWNRKSYEKALTGQQFDLFKEKERTLLMVMENANFFSKETKVGHLKNGTIVLY